MLCIDDDVLVLSLVAEALGAAGMQVETAVDGSHALQKIAMAEPPYDVLIVDARMPNLDGWRLVMHARSGGFNGKIIIFSAHLDEHEQQRYEDLMIDRIIEKPPAAGELVAAVQELAQPGVTVPGTM
ncbi:hypothetical protein BH20VER2_BH20VER2_15540 [soil metagenome]